MARARWTGRTAVHRSEPRGMPSHVLGVAKIQLPDCWAGVAHILDGVMPEPPSTDAPQRKLVTGIVIATLVIFAIAIVMLARGGGTDPPALRGAATLLDRKSVV